MKNRYGLVLFPIVVTAFVIMTVNSGEVENVRQTMNTATSQLSAVQACGIFATVSLSLVSMRVGLSKLFARL